MPPNNQQNRQRPRLTLTELLEGKEVIAEFGKTEEAKSWESAQAVGREVIRDDEPSA